MENINALLVFCEGPHDVAFCRLVFKYCFGINKKSWKFSEYPAPFNQLFKTSMENHAAKDMSLDMAHKFFLPDRTLYSQERKLFVLLFNTGGKTKTDNPKNFLNDFLPLLKQTKIFPGGANRVIDNCKYLFLYDRDHKEPSDVFSWFINTFSHIRTYDKNNQAASCMDKTVGSYLFSAPDSFGTFEDILLPMFESAQKEVMGKAAEFIDGCFAWETEHNVVKTKTAEIAKRKKAIITVPGQRKKPGSSMNVVVDQGKLITKDIFNNNNEVRLFADFVAFLADL